ncbi:type II toxin-antitoxin system PemK/MazF family toxin [Arthrobacter sp. Hz1]
MKRGDVVIAAARGGYTGKPRPVIVIQDDRFDATPSVTVCPLTTHPIEAPLIRISVDPAAGNGIERPSQIMIDKVVTMPRANVGDHLGRLSDADLTRLDRGLLVFLGLAG